MDTEIALLDEIIEHHRVKLLRLARRWVPNLTADDLLQPNDYLELETNPEFRYEEGVLEGLLTARMALLAAPASTDDANVR